MDRFIIKKTLKQNWKSLFWFAFGLFAYTWTIMAKIYPVLQQNTATFEKLFQTYPKEFLQLFGFDTMKMDFANFISGEYLILFFPLIVGSYLAAFITRFFTKEVETTQMANLLAQPVSRVSIFLSKFVSMVMGLAFLTAVALLPIPPMAHAYGFSVEWMPVLKLTLEAFLLMLATGGFFTLVSVIFSERGQALGVSLGVFIASYLLFTFGNMFDSLKNIQWLSIFDYYKPAEILEKNVVDSKDLLVLFGVFFVTTALALLWFRKRDISV